MHYYRVSLLDYLKSSWVAHEVLQKLAKKPLAPSLPPVINKFFPAPDAKVRIKPEYEAVCCKTCGRYEVDRIFELGFREPVTIRFKEDFGYTHDRFCVINDKCLGVLRNAEVGGYESKPIGSSGWHVLRVTLRVDARKDVIRPFPPECPTCGVPRDAGSHIDHVSSLFLPKETKTLFTTKAGCAALNFRDRDIFFTEEVLQVFKEGKIKGPYCDRLWTEEELAKAKEKKTKGVNSWRPSGMTVFLSGK